MELFLGKSMEKSAAKIHNIKSYWKLGMPHWIAMFAVSLLYFVFVCLTENENFAWLITLAYFINVTVFDVRLLRKKQEKT
jgi:hypothetical protein